MHIRIVAALVLWIALTLLVLAKPALADDPCDYVDLIETGQAPADIPHDLKAEYYAACALVSPANTEREFDMEMDAAREFTAQAKEDEDNGNPVAAFYHYVRANDLYDATLISNKRNGFGDKGQIEEQIIETGQSAERVGAIALPALQNVPNGY